MDKIAGFLSPIIIYLVIFLLNYFMPGRWVTGYVTKAGSGEKLRYRLNGLLILFTTILLWVLCCNFGVIEWDWFYQIRWYAVSGAVIFGLLFSLAMVLPFPKVSNNFLKDFYLGRLENPQLAGGRIDAKMWLYLVGAIMLEINILSFTAHAYLVHAGQVSAGLYLSTALLSFFIVDYLFFEEVHLYTYDFFAERVGFKLGWGCIAFYPFFYTIPIWVAADAAPVSTPTYLLVACALLFFFSWSLSRGANLQKYFFKKNPEKSFLGIQPEVISDGNKSLLVSGFWGLSRHINYLGEIGMAIAIVLAAGHPEIPWSWLYPLYYVALLFPRQADDDRRCALKYGGLWQQYVKKVPYRIIPFIY